MDDRFVKSILKSIEVIEELSQNSDGLKISELTQKLSIHKSSVFRVLDTLSYKGIVEKDPETQKYRLGIKLLEYSANILNNMQIRNIAAPYLKALLHEFEEVVHLTVLYDGQMVYIDKLENPNSVTMYSQIGRKVPAYSTAVGKATLAFMSDDDVNLILNQTELRPRTMNTITSPDILRQELAKIRSLGYAYDEEENEPGIKAVAAPILDQFGRPVSAFSVTGPAMRMTPEKMAAISKKVVDASRKISRRLGYSYP